MTPAGLAASRLIGATVPSTFVSPPSCPTRIASSGKSCGAPGGRQRQRLPRAAVDDAEHLIERPSVDIAFAGAGQGAGQRIERGDVSLGIGGDDGDAAVAQQMMDVIDGMDGVPALLAEIAGNQTDDREQDQPQNEIVQRAGRLEVAEDAEDADREDGRNQRGTHSALPGADHDGEDAQAERNARPIGPEQERMHDGQGDGDKGDAISPQE